MLLSSPRPNTQRGSTISVSWPSLAPEDVLLVAGVGGVLAVILLLAPRSQTSSKGPLAAVMLLSLCGVAALLAWARWQETLVPEWSEEQPRMDMRGTGETLSARTDGGRIIPLSRVVKGNSYRAPETTLELQSSGNSLADSVVCTAPPTPESNCHGWVFAGGRYWIDGKVVEDILRDNCYREVAAPRPGDLIVYRSAPGAEVSHTGIVRSVSEDGAVLVESKWGSKGRFLHASDIQPQWASWSFHRSPREGHRLHGIDSIPSSWAAPLNQ